jgi:prophage regulatory protein
MQHRRKVDMAAVLKPIYIDLPDLASVVALGETTIQRMIREGQFPAPRKLSGRRVAWLVREIEEWAEQRPVSDLLPPANTGRRTNSNE